MSLTRRLFALLTAASLCGCGAVSVSIPRPGSTDPDSQPLVEAAEAPESPRKAPPSKPVGAPPPIEKEAASIQAALQKVQSQQSKHAISSGDLIEINVYQEKDLDRTVRVGPDGDIAFPMVGKIKLGGLETRAAEQALTEALRKYLVNPQVFVFLKEVGAKAAKQIYVLGEVKTPGSYPLPAEGDMTVIEAVTLAGGFTQYAASDRTRVIRRTEGKNEIFQIDITAITRRGDRSKDMALQANDVVFVPESFF